MAKEETKLCTQCKTKPRANQNGTNTWCTECNTRYQKERQVLQMTRVEAEGFVKGVRALRRVLIDELVKAGAGMMRANEVAVWIGSVAIPTPATEESESDEQPTNDAEVQPVGVAK